MKKAIQKILIIEDARVINNAITSLLEQEDFEVYSAYDLKTATQFYKDEAIDLIILDLHLPDGDGEDFILMNKSQKACKTVIFTSSEDLSRRDELFRLGIVDYINKGRSAKIIIHDILQIIENLNTNSNFTLLIVDDSAVVRLMLKTYLQPQNYTIFESKSAEDAIEFLEAGNRVNLILLDLEMQGMGGQGFLTHIQTKEEFQKIPTLVLSSHSDVNIVRDAYKSGALDFFKKPFAPEEFVLKIQQHINFLQVSSRCEMITEDSETYKVLLKHNLYHAQFHKNGKVVYTNDNFKRLFKDTKQNIQSMFSDFDTEVVKNILLSLRSERKYESKIIIQEHEFKLNCFYDFSHNASKIYNLLLTPIFKDLDI